MLGDMKLRNYAFIIQKVAFPGVPTFNPDVGSKQNSSRKLSTLRGEKRQPSVSVLSSALVKEGEASSSSLYQRIRVFRSKARLYAFDPRPQLIGEFAEIMGVWLVPFRLQGDRKIEVGLIGHGIASYLSDSREGEAIQSSPKLIEELTQFKRGIHNASGHLFVEI